MHSVTFDDLMLIRAGTGENANLLTTGDCISEIRTIETPEEWKIKATAMREIFLQTLGELPDIVCPLSPEIEREEDCGDYIKRTVSYLVAPDERIRAYVLIPQGLSGKCPVVLTIHQTTELGKEQTIGNDPTPEGQDQAYGLHLAKRGFITLSYDLLSAGERQYPGCKPFDTAPFYEKYPNWSVRGKDLWDVTRAIDFLQSMDEVNPDKIGSMGHSQGGGITIHAMVADSRIKAGACNCGDWPVRLSKNPFHHARTEWWIGRPRLRPYCYSAKPFPIDMHECLALIAPRAIMNITALNDFNYTEKERDITEPAFVNLAQNVSNVFSLMGVPDNFQNITHFHEHTFVRKYREIAYAFLDEKLMSSQQR